MTVQYTTADGQVIDVEATTEVAELLAKTQASGGKGDGIMSYRSTL